MLSVHLFSYCDVIPRQRINIQITYVTNEKFLIVVVERTDFCSPCDSLTGYWKAEQLERKKGCEWARRRNRRIRQG
jgi:hypothetical protein